MGFNNIINDRVWSSNIFYFQKKTIIKMDIVEIFWLDAQSSLETMSLSEAKNKFKPQLTKSVGYLVLEKSDFILLAFMKFGDELYKHWQVIPKECIKTRKVVK